MHSLIHVVAHLNLGWPVLKQAKDFKSSHNIYVYTYTCDNVYVCFIAMKHILAMSFKYIVRLYVATCVYANLEKAL